MALDVPDRNHFRQVIYNFLQRIRFSGEAAACWQGWIPSAQTEPIKISLSRDPPRLNATVRASSGPDCGVFLLSCQERCDLKRLRFLVRRSATERKEIVADNETGIGQGVEAGIAGQEGLNPQTNKIRLPILTKPEVCAIVDDPAVRTKLVLEFVKLAKGEESELSSYRLSGVIRSLLSLDGYNRRSAAPSIMRGLVVQLKGAKLQPIFTLRRSGSLSCYRLTECGREIYLSVTGTKPPLAETRDTIRQGLWALEAANQKEVDDLETEVARLQTELGGAEEKLRESRESLEGIKTALNHRPKS